MDRSSQKDPRASMEHEILSLGASRPTRVVGLFHGLGGSRVSLEPLALQWAEALPRTAFLLFDAGDGDWFPYPKKRAEVHTEEAWVEMVLEAVRGAIGRADALLDERLGALGLTNDALVLGGFSQGAAMSAYTGLRRGCLGVLPMGGPCPPRAKLMPASSWQSHSIQRAMISNINTRIILMET